MVAVRYLELRSYTTLIESIHIDSKSRDDIPKILVALKHIYLDESLRKRVYDLLWEDLSQRVSMETGRLGMELWKAFVMCTIRANLNWDFDRLHNMVNNHMNIRAILGHEWSDNYQYKLQTVKDNYQLFSVELINLISQIVVEEGHSLIKKKTMKN